jgi:tetratricopeptide (TPR) repeat protein
MEALLRLETEVNDPDEKAALMINVHGCYCDLSRLDEADQILTQIRSLDPSPDVRLVVDFGEACMHIQMGQIERGLTEFEAMLIRDRESLQSAHRDIYEDIQRRRGIAFSSLHKAGEALPLLREASSFVARAEDKQEVFFYLGICHMQLRESAIAKDNLLDAVRVGIKNELDAHARYRLALIYSEAGAFAQARLYLEGILQEYGHDIPNLPNQYICEFLARTSRELGDEQGAEKYEKEAREQ